MTDELHYVRLPNAFGGRAEMVRYCFTLAHKPWKDVLHAREEFASAGERNPYKQFPYLVTSTGEVIPQSMAIMCHAAHGTDVWPTGTRALTHALSVAQGAYDLYQAFGGFAADDLVAKKKFEERRAPQYFGALATYYAERPFAAGTTASFADCIAREAIAWCVRKNEVAKGLLEASPALGAFVERFDAIPAIATFQARQRAAREADPSV
jgi:glutathione S-transferase